MHTVILGPGSLGLLFAANFSAVGPVTLIGRPGCALQSFHYSIRSTEGLERCLSLPLQASDHSLPRNIGLVLVSTKAQATLDALTPLLPRLNRTVPVVLLQNGMGSQQAVAACYPDHPIIAATTTEGANRPKTGLLVHAGEGQTWLGALTPGAESHLDRVARYLSQAGFHANVTADIQAKLWDKLAVNAGINPFTALLDLPNGALPGHPLFEQWIQPLSDEIAAVAQAEGIALQAEPLRERIRAVCMATADNISSMLQDIRAERESEIDFINGYLVVRAEHHGIEVPINRELTRRVQALARQN